MLSCLDSVWDILLLCEMQFGALVCVNSDFNESLGVMSPLQNGTEMFFILLHLLSM